MYVNYVLELPIEVPPGSNCCWEVYILIRPRLLDIAVVFIISFFLSVLLTSFHPLEIDNLASISLIVIALSSH